MTKMAVQSDHGAESGISYIRGFHGVRAISVTIVLLSHFAFYGNWLDEDMAHMVDGGTGVTIFFVLSGFLITSILIAEKKDTGTVSLRNFYLRRAGRIFPCFYLFMTVLLALRLAGIITDSYPALLASALYMYNFTGVYHMRGEHVSHTWSLAVEEHFYLCFPLLFKHCRRRLLPALVVLFLACKVIQIWLLQVDFLTERFKVQHWSFIAGSHILLGCILALMCADHKKVLSDWLRSKSSGWLVLLVALALLSSPWWARTWPLVPLFTLRSLGVGLVIAHVYLCQQSLFVRFLEIPPLRYLGMISYGVYLWHGLFRRPLFEADSWLASYGPNLVLTVAMAAVSYHFFELPVNRWVRRKAHH